ncbi:Crp/Fnr family transcriptional regulator [Panacibacter ginsenosidivorans]|nr:Crp/Fnr family transcriptional regulator [Panacibacter ginsenosidivorans]
MENLFTYLKSIHPLSAALQQHLSTVLKIKELSRKEYLLKRGRINKEICFIEKGLLRCFYLKKDKEVCSWFMKEGDVIISVESFFRQQVSNESIQALENCTLYYLTYSELQYIFHHYPEFNFVGRVLTEQYYTLSEQRLYSIRMQRASERYDYLLNNFPEIIQRVPSKYIASYLSITEETLSRIRSHH